MDDICTYQIAIGGQVTEDDIRSIRPPGLKIELAGEIKTFLTVRTDQTGMVGLIRNLHGLGFTLLLVHCIETEALKEEYHAQS
jgi:hypothetical protein